MRLLLRPFVFTAAAVVGVLGFIAWLPSSWWLVELTASWRVQILLGALALGAIALALRGWIAVSIAVATVVLCGPSVASAFLRATPDAPDGASTLRVGHVNLQKQPLPLDDIVKEARARRTDVFVLMSVRAEDRENLPARVGEYAIFVPPLARDFAMLTRERIVAIIDPYVYALPGSSISVAVELDDGTRVSLLGLHTQSPMTPNRTSGRNVQLRAIGEWANDRDGPHVAFGDFNTTPWSHEFERVLRDADLDSSLDGFGLQPSWPARLGPFGITIDHLLHSSDLVTVGRATGPTFGSEHRSLWVTLAVR